MNVSNAIAVKSIFNRIASKSQCAKPECYVIIESYNGYLISSNEVLADSLNVAVDFANDNAKYEFKAMIKIRLGSKLVAIKYANTTKWSLTSLGKSKLS